MMKLVSWIWPEFNWAAWATVGGVAGGSLAILEYQLLDRILGRHIPLFSLATKLDKFAWGGIALAFVLAIVLSNWESNRDVAEAQAAEQSKAQQEQRDRILKSPDVQRGLEILKDYQAKKNDPSTSRPVTTRASATKQSRP
jgi:hypothetical protein